MPQMARTFYSFEWNVEAENGDSDFFNHPKKKKAKEDLPPGKRFVSQVSNDQMAVILKEFIPPKLMLKRTAV